MNKHIANEYSEELCCYTVTAYKNICLSTRNYGSLKSHSISWHLRHDSHCGPLTVKENTKITVFVGG